MSNRKIEEMGETTVAVADSTTAKMIHHPPIDRDDQLVIDRAEAALRDSRIPPGQRHVSRPAEVAYQPADRIAQTEAKHGHAVSADRWGRRRVFRDGSQLTTGEMTGTRFVPASQLDRLDRALNRRTWHKAHLQAAESALRFFQREHVQSTSTDDRYEFGSGPHWNEKILGRQPLDEDGTLKRLAFLVQCRRDKLIAIEQELLSYGFAG